MVSLAGCTAMDVVSLLKKMRVEVESFSVRVVGQLTEEHPKHYTAMHIIYEFKGTDLPMDKLEKAVSLSEEKYCGISATFKKAMLITTEIVIL
jgi:putative redox protein